MDTSTFGLSFGERLGYVRYDHALTAKAMAASIGVAPATWRKYEKDESFPSVPTLWKFCGVYHVNREWLNTSEGEVYTDGYKPGDELGKPISYEEMLLQELMKGRGGMVFSAGNAADRLNQIIEDL